MPHRMNTKLRIVREAAILFSKYGYDAVSMRQIASAAEIRSGSIYHHFESKDDILNHWVDSYLQTLRDYLPSLQSLESLLKSKSPKEILRQFAFDYPDEDLESILQIYRVLFSEQYRNAKLRGYLMEELLHSQTAVLAQMLDVLVELGSIPPCNSMDIAQAFVYTLIGICLEATMDAADLKELGKLKMEVCDYLIELAVKGTASAR